MGLALTVQGEPVETVVNATGAGDAFMGGLVYAYLRDMPPGEALPFATAAARMAIAHQNTINPNISAENVWEVARRERLACRSC